MDTDGQPRTVSLTELAPYVAGVAGRAALVGHLPVANRGTTAGCGVRAGLRLAGRWIPGGASTAAPGRAGTCCSGCTAGSERRARSIRPSWRRRTWSHAGLADDRDERSRFLDRAEDAARRADQPGAAGPGAGRAADPLRRGGPDGRGRAGLPRGDRAGRAHRGAGCGAAGGDDARRAAVAARTPWTRRRSCSVAPASWRRDGRRTAAGVPSTGCSAWWRCAAATWSPRTTTWWSRCGRGCGTASGVRPRTRWRRSRSGAPSAATRRTAAMLFGGAEAVRGARRATGCSAPSGPGSRPPVRSALGDAAFDAAYAEGAELGFDRIVATGAGRRAPGPGARVGPLRPPEIGPEA